MINKYYKYRIYPTPAQEARIIKWESTLRWLWNLAHEQRLMGLARPKDERIYPSAFDQINELTELKKIIPWLHDVPRAIANTLLMQLDDAWQRCFKKLSKKPNWKRKGKGFLGLTEPSSKQWKLNGDKIRFPKLGNIQVVVDRLPEGKPRSCTIKRDGDQWFISCLYEVEVAEPTKRTAPVVAIDVGVTNFTADSDGKLIPNPKFLERTQKRLAQAQRSASRKKKGSKNQKKAYNKVMRLHRKVRRQREWFHHDISSNYSKNHGIVIVEDLQIDNIVKNSNLSRSISDAGWSNFVRMLEYKLRWSGGELIKVAAQYSSQTCSVCEAVDAKSRSKEKFCCTSCHYEDHADLNAAKVLKSRTNRSVQPVEGSLKLGTLRSRKQKVKPIVVTLET